MRIEQIRETLRKEIDNMDDSSLLTFYSFWLNFRSSLITDEDLKERSKIAKVRGKIDLDIDLGNLRDRKDLNSQTPPEDRKS